MLEDFAREHFGVREIAYRWSTQDNYSADGAPLMGRLTPRSRQSYTATGFRKWGLAMGAAAAGCSPTPSPDARTPGSPSTPTG